MLLKADGKDMISAFLSGYALSKIDHLIDTLFKGDIYKDQMVVARLLILFIAMIIFIYDRVFLPGVCTANTGAG